MAYKISDDCIACGTCLRYCPNGALSEGDPIFVIDPAMCTECVGANPFPACVEQCPTEAIALDDSREETKEELLARWQSLHPGETPRMFAEA